MTHPPGQPGGGGGSDGGTTGPGRVLVANYDRVVDVLAAATDRAFARMKAAWLTGDQVAAADARGSLVDLRTAAHIRGGAAPADLDRMGWPSGQLLTTPKESAMRFTPRGGPDTGNPHPTPTGPANPDVPRVA